MPNYFPSTTKTNKPGLGLLAACGGPSNQEKREAAATTPAQTVVAPPADLVHLPAP